jgi:hypothetical protein
MDENKVMLMKEMYSLVSNFFLLKNYTIYAHSKEFKQ